MNEHTHYPDVSVKELIEFFAQRSYLSGFSCAARMIGMGTNKQFLIRSAKEKSSDSPWDNGYADGITSAFGA